MRTWVDWFSARTHNKLWQGDFEHSCNPSSAAEFVLCRQMYGHVSCEHVYKNEADFLQKVNPFAGDRSASAKASVSDAGSATSFGCFQWRILLWFLSSTIRRMWKWRTCTRADRNSFSKHFRLTKNRRVFFCAWAGSVLWLASYLGKLTSLGVTSHVSLRLLTGCHSMLLVQ